MSAVRPVATYEDLLALPPHHVGEIIDGVLHSQPRPAVRHARSASSLGGRLYGFDGDGGGTGPGGWWILVEPELHLGRHVLVPDLSGWRRENLPALPDAAWIEQAPDWVCEVLSPGTLRIDRGPKLRIYAEHGVRHAWLLDPIGRQLEIYERNQAGRWELLEVQSGDDQVRAAPFESMLLPLSALWLPEPPPVSG